MCASLGNKHQQLLSTGKQLVREGIRNQIEGEALSGCAECKDGAAAGVLGGVRTFIFIWTNITLRI